MNKTIRDCCLQILIFSRGRIHYVFLLAFVRLKFVLFAVWGIFASTIFGMNGASSEETNDEIDEILKRHRREKKNFQGIF